MLLSKCSSPNIKIVRRLVSLVILAMYAVLIVAVRYTAGIKYGNIGLARLVVALKPCCVAIYFLRGGGNATLLTYRNVVATAHFLLCTAAVV